MSYRSALDAENISVIANQEPGITCLTFPQLDAYVRNTHLVNKAPCDTLVAEELIKIYMKHQPYWEQFGMMSRENVHGFVRCVQHAFNRVGLPAVLRQPEDDAFSNDEE